MRGIRLMCVVALVAAACGADSGEPDAREPGELLAGELIGRLDGEPFPVRYGHLSDWDGDWGARLGFLDGPVSCSGEYPSAPPVPQFHAWIELEMDPESGQSWEGAHTIMQNTPRVVVEFASGQLHLDRVEEDSISGTLSWGGRSDEYDVTYSLEGTFTVERCYREYPGD